ncbi:MAG: nuclear transport factor 2 family protein [Microthrixaceae bacterium]
MNIEDCLAIESVLAWYGHLVDSQAWERFHEVFTEDAVFDATSLKLPLMATLSGIRDGFAGMAHPVAHLTTNVVFGDDSGYSEGPVKVSSKFLCPLRGGKVLTGEYHDTLVKTGNGWRIAKRRVEVLRPRENSL